jgi:hypothetical protein
VLGTACSNQTCVSGACQGSCAPGQVTCSGALQPQNCSGTGNWQNNGSVCATSCSSGACVAPECQASDGGLYQCPSGDNCCGNTSDYSASCAATCPAGTSALDCTGTTGANECASGTVCCGNLILNGSGSPPNCGATSLTSACATSCTDKAPSNPFSCGAAGTSYTVRLCRTKADCTGSSNGDTNCCSCGTISGKKNPVYLCEPSAATLVCSCL